MQCCTLAGTGWCQIRQTARQNGGLYFSQPHTLRAVARVLRAAARALCAAARALSYRLHNMSYHVETIVHQVVNSGTVNSEFARSRPRAPLSGTRTSHHSQRP